MRQIPITPGELKRRYPYQFQGPYIGFDFTRGWFRLFAETCMDVDSMLSADKRGFHWMQLKEKFGSARWYWKMDVPRDEAERSLKMRASEHVGAAVDRTLTMCIVCGEAGKVDAHGGWHLVLCPHHKQMRRVDRESMRAAAMTDDTPLSRSDAT